jgi:predicted transposase YdaD
MEGERKEGRKEGREEGRKEGREWDGKRGNTSSILDLVIRDVWESDVKNAERWGKKGSQTLNISMGT